MLRYLGIDWGKNKIGLALADEETKLAMAYLTLKNDKQFFDKLKTIISQENIKEEIIGKPLYTNSNKNQEEINRFLADLKKKLPGMEIFFQNEMFTTQSAQANLKEKQVKKIKRWDDQESARIILQDWLEANFI